MPLLFAATLFVSASLLFMIQPMIGKMVLPLLGGSPAVWNACMVFFQALLLLGYLYAHKLSDINNPKKQWMIHLGVLALPLAAFALAAVFSSRHMPIAIAESLAPTDDRSPIIGVLLILTVAIGVPFFVVSTTATLLQKWFVFTGHPSARDPYFLYSASNIGSLISLLGYPLVIEPRMSIAEQTWVFAVGFSLLAGMIFFCGRAAANPIGVPPPASQGRGKQGEAAKVSVTVSDPAPTLARKLKWVALSFVPSTLMLGVTFHMTTDIASVPLLWVAPLALYLVTFIIAFGRVPDWFRMVIGNLAPVMILLLVFVLISGVSPGVGIELSLHILTFFAAALMCHYELARDRPSPQYLTGFFLLMSVGGVLGGVFNSLVAPLLFPHAYEYKIALVIACLLVPNLLAGEEVPEPEPERDPTLPPPTLSDQVSTWLPLAGVIANSIVLALGMLTLYIWSPRPIPLGGSSTLDPITVLNILAVLVVLGIASVLGAEWYGRMKRRQKSHAGDLWNKLSPTARAGLLIIANPIALPWAAVAVVRTTFRLRLYLDLLAPVAVGIGFYMLSVVAGKDWFTNACNSISQTINLSFDTIRVVMIYAVPVMICFFFVDRPLRFALCVAAILGPTTYLEASNGLIHSDRSFFGILKITEDASFQFIRDSEGKAIQKSDGSLIVAGRYKFRKLVHGTTLHGTQIAEHERHFLDDFQMLALGVNPWDAVAVACVTKEYDARQEPLTYYHRTGPVGAMFSELRSRKGGADANAHFSMVGLGTGSVSCYARPGQRLTFYEIDTSVRKLVADTDQYFTYVGDARRRGANVEILMGDARLKLKDATDHKYTLLLVDAFSSDSIPVHLLTVQAVQLYLDRMTEDGILALHISNKFVKLEPVVARIAEELGLTARVWNDDAERRPGKTASSWVVLARKPEYLGKLFSTTGDLLFSPTRKPGEDDRMEVSMEHQLFQGLAIEFDELRETGTSKKAKYMELNELPPDKVKDAWIAWATEKMNKTTDPVVKARLAQYVQLMTRYSPHVTFQEVMLSDHGHAFRRLETLIDVPAWTDDYSDVLRVMMIPELQKVRGFFGLPTPVKR